MSNATKVGLVTFVALLVLIFGLVWKSGLFVRAYGYRLFGNFETISGLLLNAQVRYRGYLVGYVEDIHPATRGIKVTIIIKKGIVLPANARLRVSFDGLIGEKYMDIIPQEPTDEILREGTLLQGYASKGLVDFVDVGTQSLEETKKILLSLREIMTSPEVEKSIKDTILRVDSISLRLDNLLQSLNQIAVSPEVHGLKTSINNLNSFISELRQTILNKDSAQDLKHILDNTNTTMQNIKIASDGFINVVGNLDSITKDNGATSDIKIIVDQTRESLSSTSKILGGISSISIYPQAEAYQRTYNNGSNYIIGFGVDYAKVYSTSFDFSNRGGANKLAYFQQGVKLTEDLTGRIGLIRNLPGMGVDYSYSDALAMSLDFPYDQKINLDYRLKYSPFLPGFLNKIYLMVGGELTFQRDNSFIFGIGF